MLMGFIFGFYQKSFLAFCVLKIIIFFNLKHEWCTVHFFTKLLQFGYCFYSLWDEIVLLADLIFQAHFQYV